MQQCLRNVEVHGSTRLIGASIKTGLQCSGSRFIYPGRITVDAEGASISHGVIFDENLARGEVSVKRASIDGDLDCRRSIFIDPAGKALNADSVKVSDEILLSDGFEAEGKVVFSNATAATFNLTNAAPKNMELVLDASYFKVLNDDRKSWPVKGSLSLHGFIYDRIGKGSPKDTKCRLKWLQLQATDQYSPQPYEQLAKVLKASGDEHDATNILIAKGRDYKRWAKLSFGQQVWHNLSGFVMDYGYRPIKALWFMLIASHLSWHVGLRINGSRIVF